MGNILICAIIAFIITFYAIPIIIQLADEAELYDHPDERKVHKNPIPSLGGLGIFMGFMMGLLLSQPIFNKPMGEHVVQLQQMLYFFAAFLVVFFYGIKDDILTIKPMKKLLGQLFVSIIIIFKARLMMSNLYGFLGVTYIIESFKYMLTFAIIVVVMNAFNLIDGVDGLAGTLGVVTASVFAAFFYLNGDLYYALMGFVLAASIIAFLIYNYTPAKIFMGDTGSMLIGLVNSILAIRFIETAAASSFFPKNTSPAMAFGILLVPLLDTLRVFGIRIMHGRSPFSPDRNHLHHLLLDRGFNHRKILYALIPSALLFIIMTYFALPLGTTYVILLQIVVFFGSIALFTSLVKPVKFKVQQKVVETPSLPDDTISPVI